MTELRIRSTEPRASAFVDDVVFGGPDGEEVEAYLVRPAAEAGGERRPAIVMWHWLDSESPDGNRTQYLDEATELAGLGAVALLPQGRFPWSSPPTGAAADALAVRAEVARVRAGLDLLAARPDVDPGRLGVVGHDFGGMFATIAAAEDERVRSLVVVAAAPRWGDWFLLFWDLPDDRLDYLRDLRPLDPVEVIGRASAAVLLQYGRRDFYIATMSALELRSVAPAGTDLQLYDSGHDMRSPEIHADRRAFLARTVGLEAR
jgi:pimeloyl-ACP methyl ester carboxylesterase